jgi:rRNA maturation endonuclease Nob1
MTKKSCVWKEDEEYGMWETGCKNAFEFIEGDIKENSFKFCPYCGSPIEQVHP